LHWEQEEEAARRWEMEAWSEEVDVEGEKVSLGGGGGPWLGPRGIMVLFLKQVHLQKVGAAVRERGELVWFGVWKEGEGARKDDEGE
jgi:hypothetical protein